MKMVPGLSDAVSAATAAVVAAHAQAQSQAQAQAEAQMQEAEEEEEEEQVELGGERKEDVSRTSKAHRRRCWLGPGYRFHHRTTKSLLDFRQASRRVSGMHILIEQGHKCAQQTKCNCFPSPGKGNFHSYF